MTRTLPRATPESQGIPSSSILSFVQEIEKQVQYLHSFMLLRHGQVVAEGWWKPYAPELPHVLFSLSKSFTSTAIGMLVDEGRLSVDDAVISFFPDDLPPEPSENLKAMRVRHLLSMSTGHATDTTGSLHQEASGNWPKAFLARPVENAPGAPFVYNSGATFMLSAIVQKLTGMTLLDYLRPRLFEPLGIDNPTWETNPQGINTGGWGLNIRTEDIAKFGQLYLQKGVWEGKQLVSAAWIAEASCKQVSNGTAPESDWQQGYGYQFWRCQHNAYRGDGAFGQYCIVMPDQDAVLAITSGLGDMQTPMNLVWKHLLLAMAPAPLPADASAKRALDGRLSNLQLPPVEGEASSPLAAKLAGATFRFDANDQKAESVRLTFDDGKLLLTLRAAGTEQQIVCGHGKWLQGELKLGSAGPNPTAHGPVAGSYAWVAPDTLVTRHWYIQGTFCVMTTWRFAGEQLTIESRMNVSFGPTERPTLTARLVKQGVAVS